MSIWLPWLFFGNPDLIYKAFLFVTFILYGGALLFFAVVTLLSSAGVNISIPIDGVIIGLYGSAGVLIINSISGHFSAKIATYLAIRKR